MNIEINFFHIGDKKDPNRVINLRKIMEKCNKAFFFQEALEYRDFGLLNFTIQFKK